MALRIVNWEKWQTYRNDRGAPSWIKVHRNLMSNNEWAILTDAEKGQILSIWIIAADKEGQITSNPKIIKKICQLDEEPNINKFIDLKFLVAEEDQDGYQSVTKWLPGGGQSDAPDKIREEKRRGDKRRVEKHLCKKVPLHDIDDNDNELFDNWWSIYPKKKAKAAARKAWDKCKVDKQMLIDDITNRVANDPQWQDIQFVPFPATYLNGHRWEDEIVNTRGNGNGTAKKQNASQFLDNCIAFANGGTVDRCDIFEDAIEVPAQMVKRIS
jgi:hypothetical protein